MRYLVLILLLWSCAKKTPDKCSGKAELTISNSSRRDLNYTINEAQQPQLASGKTTTVSVYSGKVHVYSYYILMSKKVGKDVYLDLEDCEKYSVTLTE
jgi:hypothetical protein